VALLKKEMQFERSFVKAGGLLLAGFDPTGYGGILPGFGDQRGMELLGYDPAKLRASVAGDPVAPGEL
jgi:hypothetical protein